MTVHIFFCRMLFSWRGLIFPHTSEFSTQKTSFKFSFLKRLKSAYDEKQRKHIKEGEKFEMVTIHIILKKEKLRKQITCKKEKKKIERYLHTDIK